MIAVDVGSCHSTRHRTVGRGARSAVAAAQLFRQRVTDNFCFVLRDLQGEAADLKPFDAQLMLPIDRTPVSLLLDGTHVGRGSEWSG